MALLSARDFFVKDRRSPTIFTNISFKYIYKGNCAIEMFFSRNIQMFVAFVVVVAFDDATSCRKNDGSVIRSEQNFMNESLGYARRIPR